MRKLGPVLILCLFLTACASVLSQIATWAPLGQVAITGFASIVSVTNPSLGNEATAIGVLIGDVGTAAAAADSAGGTQTGVAKVISEITAVDQQLSKFENDLTAAGANVGSNDQKYVVEGVGAVLAVLEGYLAIEQAKAGGTPTAMLDVHGSCYGFETTAGHGPYHAWTDCDPDNPVDLEIPDPTGPTAKTVVSAKKPPTAANFKRNLNALAKKYGRPGPYHITMGETAVHVLTLGRR